MSCIKATACFEADALGWRVYTGEGEEGGFMGSFLGGFGKGVEELVELALRSLEGWLWCVIRDQSCGWRSHMSLGRLVARGRTSLHCKLH